MKVYIKRENFNNYTLDDIVMRMTSSGNFTCKIVKDDAYRIAGVTING